MGWPVDGESGWLFAARGRHRAVLAECLHAHHVLAVGFVDARTHKARFQRQPIDDLRRPAEPVCAAGYCVLGRKCRGFALGAVLRHQLICGVGSARCRDGFSGNVGRTWLISLQLSAVFGRICGAVEHGLAD